MDIWMDIWNKVAMLEEIPLLGSRVVASDQGDIAIFRTGEGAVFAPAKCIFKRSDIPLDEEYHFLST